MIIISNAVEFTDRPETQVSIDNNYLGIFALYGASIALTQLCHCPLSLFLLLNGQSLMLQGPTELKQLFHFEALC